MKLRLGLVPCLIPLLVACGGAAAPSAGPSTTTASAAVASKPAASAIASAAAAPASAKPATSAAASAKPAASGAPAANPTFSDGTVKTLDQGKLTLVDGKSFTVAANSSFSKLQKETPADIKAGQFVAITGKLQSDGKMLATFVRVQDSSGGRPASQFPMEAFAEGQPVTGNLMTNAPVKSAAADSMIITLPAGDLTVQFGPGIQIMHQVDGSASDVQPGKKVLVVHRGDAAANVGVYV